MSIHTSLYVACLFVAPLAATAAEGNTSQPVEAPLAPIHGSDHGQAMSRRLALATFEVGNVPVATFNGTAVGAPSQVNTPALGLRVWLSKMRTLDVGLDVGIGFTFASGNSQQSAASGTTGAVTTTSSPLAIPAGVYVHGGLPLAVGATDHVTFEIIPELNLGGAWSNPTPNASLNGFIGSIGARVGPEIHLGFWGMPEVAILPTFGVAFNVQYAGGSFNPGTTNATKTSAGEVDLAFTTVGLALSFLYYPG